MCSAKTISEGKTDFTGINFCCKFKKENISSYAACTNSLDDNYYSQDFSWPLTILSRRARFAGFKWFIKILSPQ